MLGLAAVSDVYLELIAARLSARARSVTTVSGATQNPQGPVAVAEHLCVPLVGWGHQERVCLLLLS
jgi:hypothetical protein